MSEYFSSIRQEDNFSLHANFIQSQKETNCKFQKHRKKTNGKFQKRRKKTNGKFQKHGKKTNGSAILRQKMQIGLSIALLFIQLMTV